MSHIANVGDFERTYCGLTAHQTVTLRIPEENYSYGDLPAVNPAQSCDVCVAVHQRLRRVADAAATKTSPNRLFTFDVTMVDRVSVLATSEIEARKYTRAIDRQYRKQRLARTLVLVKEEQSL
jgi:hypothetical protein